MANTTSFDRSTGTGGVSGQYPSADTTITFTTTSSSCNTFSDDACGTISNTAVIKAGTAEATAYFKETGAGIVTVSARETPDQGSVTQEITFK